MMKSDRERREEFLQAMLAQLPRLDLIVDRAAVVEKLRGLIAGFAADIRDADLHNEDLHDEHRGKI